LSPANPFHPNARRRRALHAIVAIALMLGVLGAAFFRTQIVQNEEFTLQSEGNRFRLVPSPAARGTVYDRNGQVIAETVSGYTLEVEPGPPDSVRARVAPLLPLIGMDSSAMGEILERARKHPLEPVTVSDGLTFAQVSRLAERLPQYPWAMLDARPVRHYRYGESVAHLIGYVGEISDTELASDDWQGYRSGQTIGKAGIERQYERVLGGTAGARYVEVDARGKLVGRFTAQHSVPSTPGKDVHLTIDLDLQRYAHQIFPAGMRGAIVAMEPGSGEILALYSHPTYDPNQLIGRITPAVWRQLNGDPARPLVDRTTRGTYPPGSTWKLATAIVGLERKAITPEERMPFACTGGMSYAGRYSRCWKRDGHGYLNLAGAIAKSCNVYFYQLGIRLGLDRLAREGTRLGFARPTGVDLPHERTGTFPTDREWYFRRFRWRPVPSEVMSLSIGQGPNAQTPLRMAQFYAALAGDGTSARPHLVKTDAPAPVETDLHVSPQTIQAVRVGLAEVVEEGTARAVALRRWKLYGKTGTSQNSQDLKRPHAWFTGFAGPPGGEPEVVVAAIVEFGEHGNTTAAPLAAQMAEYYLNKRHGIRNPPLAEQRSPEPAPRPAAPRRTRPAADTLAPRDSTARADSVRRDSAGR
jgi:penicillin-binding protein 2